MRKFLTTAIAAVTASGAVLATAMPASAEHRYYRHHRGGSDKAAVAAIAGIAGLALGAALSSKSDSRGYYSSSGYSSRNTYRDTPYSYGYGYDPRYDRYDGGGYGDYYERPYVEKRTCSTRERVYDPYIGRRVTIERRYAC